MKTKPVRYYMIVTKSGFVIYTIREVVENGVIREVLTLEGGSK
jgi:hypothetical protein